MSKALLGAAKISSKVQDHFRQHKAVLGTPRISEKVSGVLRKSKGFIGVGSRACHEVQGFFRSSEGFTKVSRPSSELQGLPTRLNAFLGV